MFKCYRKNRLRKSSTLCNIIKEFKSCDDNLKKFINVRKRERTLIGYFLPFKCS